VNPLRYSWKNSSNLISKLVEFKIELRKTEEDLSGKYKLRFKKSAVKRKKEIVK